MGLVMGVVAAVVAVVAVLSLDSWFIIIYCAAVARREQKTGDIFHEKEQLTVCTNKK